MAVEIGISDVVAEVVPGCGMSDGDGCNDQGGISCSSVLIIVV